MKRRSNALLVELMIVIMFFMLASTFLMEVFAKSHELSEKAEAIAEAVMDVQNVADSLYVAGEPEDVLLSMGFEKTQDGYLLVKEDYEMRVTDKSEDVSTGTMYYREVQALRNSEALITLPVTRFEEATDP